MKHARSDYDRIQDPALEDPSLLAPGSSPIGADEPVMLFRAQDRHFPRVLTAYLAALAADPFAEDAIIRTVALHLAEALRWQAEHKDRVKTPDVPAKPPRSPAQAEFPAGTRVALPSGRTGTVTEPPGTLLGAASVLMDDTGAEERFDARNLRSEPQGTPYDLNRSGHGHVRPAMVKARCGGPAICSECLREAIAVQRAYRSQVERGLVIPPDNQKLYRVGDRIGRRGTAQEGTVEGVNVTGANILLKVAWDGGEALPYVHPNEVFRIVTAEPDPVKPPIVAEREEFQARADRFAADRQAEREKAL